MILMVLLYDHINLLLLNDHVSPMKRYLDYLYDILLFFFQYQVLQHVVLNRQLHRVLLIRFPKLKKNSKKKNMKRETMRFDIFIMIIIIIQNWNKAKPVANKLGHRWKKKKKLYCLSLIWSNQKSTWADLIWIFFFKTFFSYKFQRFEIKKSFGYFGFSTNKIKLNIPGFNSIVLSFLFDQKKNVGCEWELESLITVNLLKCNIVNTIEHCDHKITNILFSGSPVLIRLSSLNWIQFNSIKKIFFWNQII